MLSKPQVRQQDPEGKKSKGWRRDWRTRNEHKKLRDPHYPRPRSFIRRWGCIYVVGTRVRPETQRAGRNIQKSGSLRPEDEPDRTQKAAEVEGQLVVVGVKIERRRLYLGRSIFHCTNPVLVPSPQAELRNGSWRFIANKRAREAVSPTATSESVMLVELTRVPEAQEFQMASELPSSDLLQLLAQRLQTEQAPPYTLVGTGDG
ncbi:hypothetical protein C8F04DRAFT_1188731 [Mycena alexandri]|uniref:Uncharacterized protein n=1 Tax=Mycena alexandri TaxID=1745969 RepID=A0AAD6SK76_9AGAR|nr:hypothetical protein C8F04DRAFT_1188731 [Mycena alexandri]